jgi:hypothetical protein
MINWTDKIAAVAEAIDAFASKSVVASAWKTADWAAAPQEIAARSFFSAGVESAAFLTRAQTGCRQALDLSLDEYGRVADREKFIADMRGLALALGLGAPDEPANVKNLAGATRLGMIWDMNVEGARGRARRKAGLSEGALFAAPAQELVRGRPARLPRNWTLLWREAGDKVAWEGAVKADPLRPRFIALKTSPIWAALSQFGTPWAPFRFGSGMVLRSLPREDAIRLGLVEPDEILEPDPDPGFNAALAASMQNVSPDLATRLKTLLGDRIAIEGNNVKLVEQA